MSKSSPVGFSPSNAANLESAQKVGSLDPRLSRTDYFDGRLLTATDLLRDQTYVDERVLEVGRALGSGVVRGLAVVLSNDKRYLRVEPGLAISESGRVLEVNTDKPLEIDLYDRALLIALNKGRYRRFNRGLYAVTLQFIDMGSDSAESYPADPTEKNEFQFDSYIEGAEITLTPLNYPLPSDNELVSRSILAKHFLRNPGQPREISDQAISLGVLAINNDRPQWLDTHLLRRPMRPEHISATWQMDMNRHYLELLDSVMQVRTSQSQDGEFSAAQYFHILPPAGVLPMGSVDPAKSAQYFFPENYTVSISPVRFEDLAVIESESMQLAPLDLDSDEAAEIMILAPMSNQEFMDNARSLGFEPEDEALPDVEKTPNYWLHATDLLKLRLTAETVTPADNAVLVWNRIWNLIGQGNGLLHYVRRPARAAETQVSAVVLAHGFSIPDPLVDSEAELNGVRAERDEALVQLAKAVADLLEVQTERDQLLQAVDQATEINSEQSARISQLETTLESLRTQVSMLTSQKEAAEVRADRLQRILDRLENISPPVRGDLPPDIDIPPGGILPPDVVLPPGVTLPPGVVLPPDVVLPPRTTLPPGVVLPPDVVLPPRTTLPPGVVLPPDVVLPPRTTLPPGVVLPADAVLPSGNLVAAASGLTVDNIDTGGLDAVLDVRGTRDPVIREEAAVAIDQIRTQPSRTQTASVKSTDAIIKNVSGTFDPVLWKTVDQATQNGSLKAVEKIAVANADNPVKLAETIATKAPKLGIDTATAERWNTLAGSLK